MQEFIDILRIFSSFVYIHFAAFREDNWRFTQVVELIFLLDMMLIFFTDIVDPNKPLGAPIRDHAKIFTKYMKSGFAYDIIALTPFYMLKLDRKREYLLYIIKLIRLKRGFDNLDVLSLLTYYKKEQTKRLEYIIANDTCKANSKEEDLIKINDILAMGYFLKMIGIMINISCCCYLFAMFFKFLIEI